MLHLNTLKIAAIDIGSNAIRLLISRVIPRPKAKVELKRVEIIRIPLRLGDDVFTTGLISAEKADRFLTTMQVFSLMLRLHEVSYYRACATSAMREASNGDDLVARVAKEFKLSIDIISGEEESKLILASVMADLKSLGNFINIDVGGGSTELTVISHGQALQSVSFPIGTVRLMDGKVSKQTWKELEDWVKNYTKKFRVIKAMGTGGNISKLYRMSTASAKQEFMTLEALEQLYLQISSLSFADRISVLKLNPDRADVIEHAAKIYLQIMRWAKIKEIFAPQAGLKEGILLDIVQSLRK